MPESQSASLEGECLDFPGTHPVNFAPLFFFFFLVLPGLLLVYFLRMVGSKVEIFILVTDIQVSTLVWMEYVAHAALWVLRS